MKKVMTIISTVLMLFIVASCATMSVAKDVPAVKVAPDVKSVPLPEGMTSKEIYESMKTLVKKINVLGRGLAQSVNVMNDALAKKEADAGTRAEKIAILQITRVAEMHFNHYTLIKVGMAVQSKKDIMIMFALAYSTINNINGKSMIYALESAKEYATLSKCKEMVEFIELATETSNQISDIYKQVFKLFAKMAVRSIQPKEFNVPNTHKI